MADKRDTSGFVNLDYVVKNALMDMNDFSMENYKRFLQWAVRGFTDLNLYILENIKVEYLPLSSAKTAPLPSDFIDYTKIGMEINGEVWTFTMNPDMNLPRKVDECGETLPTNTQTLDDKVVGQRSLVPNFGYYFAMHFRNGQYVGEMYGLGGGFNNAYFRIDHQRNQIVFDSEVPVNEIILEYKSTGISANGSTIIPRKVVPALIAYIHWQRIENNDKFAESKKERKRQQYIDEYEKLHHFENMFTMDEYLDATYKVVNASIRR
jgi:hypothetical protein